jgi:hypothetical protein
MHTLCTSIGISDFLFAGFQTNLAIFGGGKNQPRIARSLGQVVSAQEVGAGRSPQRSRTPAATARPSPSTTNASAASSTNWFIFSEREPSIVPFVSRRQLAHRTARVVRIRDTDVARHGAGLTEHVQFAAGILADAEDAGTEL